MKNFLEKFNRHTQDEFKDCRLSSINVSLMSKKATFNFVVPEHEYNAALNQIDKIKSGVEKAYSTAFGIDVMLKKSHFDDEFFIKDIINFFNSYPSLKNTVSKDNVTILKNDAIKVQIFLVESAYSMFVSRDILKDLKEFIHANYCEEIETIIMQSDQKEEYAIDDGKQIIFDNDGGRYIKATEIEIFLGKKIDSPPMYIVDAVEADKIVTLAGKIISKRELTKKNNKNPKNHDNFFKFELEDATGIMPALYFPTVNQYQKIASLDTGTEVIFEGSLSLDSYSNALVLMIRNIAFCALPSDFKVNRKKISVPSKYKTIQPAPYIDSAQQDIFFSNALDTKAPYLSNKTFVVFDLETTGLNKQSDKIIELGAVKIENGVITQSFSTFIDPGIPIPEQATKINNITNDHVKGAPLEEAVFTDFLLFTQDAILVGQNADYFDLPFLSTAAKKYDIYYDNPLLDTMKIAQSHLKLKNYTLGTIASYFNIKNDAAHRALTDATTTAKIFMQLAKYL